MSAVEGSSAERVACDICAGTLLARNLKRHQERYHPTKVSQQDLHCKFILTTSSVESGDDDPGRPAQSHGALNPEVLQVAQPYGSSDQYSPAYIRQHRSISDAVIDRDMLDDAVSAILELHHDFSKEAMLSLLQRDYPEVPAAIRSTFVDVATSAARYVAGIEEISRTFPNSGCPTDMERARKAARSLTSWRLGPRRSSVARRIWSDDSISANATTHHRPGTLPANPSPDTAPPRRQLSVVEPLVTEKGASTPALTPVHGSETSQLPTKSADVLLMSLKESGIPICGDPQLQSESMMVELDQPPSTTDLEVLDSPMQHQQATEETTCEGTTYHHQHDRPPSRLPTGHRDDRSPPADVRRSTTPRYLQRRDDSRLATSSASRRVDDRDRSSSTTPGPRDQQTRVASERRHYDGASRDPPSGYQPDRGHRY